MITKLIFHHTGGRANDPYASSKHLTLEDIEVAHKARWPHFKSALGFWTGYSGLIFPDGSIVQTRLLGETLAANAGWNDTSFAFCLIGNFTKSPVGPVDEPTEAQKRAVERLSAAIIEGRYQDIGLKAKEGLSARITFKNIVPHRAVSLTECYGNLLSDDWARKQVIPYFERKLTLLEQLLMLYMKILDYMRAVKIGGVGRVFGGLMYKAKKRSACWEENNYV